MPSESIDSLNIVRDGVYVDLTFGGGGHSRLILENDWFFKVVLFWTVILDNTLTWFSLLKINAIIESSKKYLLVISLKSYCSMNS